MIPGPLLKPIVEASPVALRQEVQQARKIEGGLNVKFDDSEYDAATGDLTFTGHVTAEYSGSVVRAEKLRINAKNRTGTAEGDVVLTDPEGHAKAATFEFNWEKKTGFLTGVVLQADNVHIEAETLKVVPGQWDLENANLSLSRVGRAPVSFEAGSVTIYPGRSGVARRVFFHVYGMKIGPISRLSFSLRKRLKGLGLPSITNRKGLGVGVSWETNFAAGDHAVIGSFWDSFPRREPGFGLQYGYSPLGPEAATQIAPRSDLSERFADGWFDNVSVRTPQEEQDEFENERRSFAVGSFWNQATGGRINDSDNVSKRFDVVSELGGRSHGFGTFGSFRLQSIRESTQSPFLNRLTAQTTVLAPALQVNKALRGHVRLDTFASLSEHGTYGWGRVETGLIYSPTKNTTFGLAYSIGSGVGDPDFRFDGLVADQALMARADFLFGPFTFRYLNKYNVGTHQWYDREYEIAMVAREYEPYIVYRQFPSETRIGVRFRIDNLRDRLTRRDQKR